MKSEKLETVIQLRIYEDLRDKLQEMADFESRSLSQYIRLVLIHHVEDLEKRHRQKKDGKQ